ncbi:MAG TPA: DUF6580 family putative transport protein [Cytophagaceae bacterium]
MNRFTMENQKKVNLRVGVLITLILLAAFSRLIPHPLNFSPLGAIALFGAAHFSRKWQAFLIPLAATLISDFFITKFIYAGEYNWLYEGFYWQYICYVAIFALGFVLFSKVTLSRVLFGAVGASILFFVISNFGTWASMSLYPKSIEGLMACYTAAIPFYANTLLGDLVYSGVLFGSFALLQYRFPVLKLSKATV